MPEMLLEDVPGRRDPSAGRHVWMDALVDLVHPTTDPASARAWKPRRRLTTPAMSREVGEEVVVGEVVAASSRESALPRFQQVTTYGAK